MLNNLLESVKSVLDTGGPVVLLLIAISILTVTIILYKIWQFQASGVGSHSRLKEAVAALDARDKATALMKLEQSKSYLVPAIRIAMSGDDARISDRADAEAEDCFARLERGFSTLDLIAQIAPLLGLFGTVLGMIEAFQKLQTAGSSVDPSLLAGGIWVALLTTATGLAVAMPTSLALSWLEARMLRERVFANSALRTVFAPKTALEVSKAPSNYDLVSVHGA
ncbi:MotA/TolQ/ExbB proton channel family protein [Shimia sp. R10_1]|uniref:MotA/TolQ/ExbB proton channel family protein n=1 Tax=Shimia sp. R10_1 TaxID=2821095 RepID=UPI001ADAB5EE|nr:MotA/TolQ/ExbB proton channel family protein [Shimia sp. R10_1]MBO9475658.1 MotA/TolQ/ExbB proton channel family protein [Shimia sp. R10_1]